MITDIYFQDRFSHVDLARLAIEGGADTIQFREKLGSSNDHIGTAKQVLEVCAQASIPLVINDHVSIAQAIQADGVHLGTTDLAIRDARALLGESVIIGATATTCAQATAAENAGADYIGFGPVYETKSKKNPASVKGLDGLRSVCDAVNIPVIAIGGINVDRIEAVIEAGAHGVAIITAIATYAMRNLH